MARIGAVLLAAGCSSRFGVDNKLLAEIDGRPMVRLVVEAIVGAARIDEVLVVTGHDAPAIEHNLQGLPVRFAFNARWRDGIGSSIAFGVSRLSATQDGAAIVPGDMPFLTSGLIELLAAKFEELDGKSIVFPTTLSEEQRNPVVWPRRYFGLLKGLSGREGGKKFLMELAGSCLAVPIADERQFLDIDEPGTLPARSKPAAALVANQARR